MRHRKDKKRLTPTAREHKGLVLNLLKSLFKYQEIKTTQARGRELRKVAEHLITVAKKNDVYSRRRVFRIIRDKAITQDIFNSIAPRYAERKGGYTQAVKIGPRRGDGAPMVLVKLLR